jgi:hypothetical protein
MRARQSLLSCLVTLNTLEAWTPRQAVRFTGANDTCSSPRPPPSLSSALFFQHISFLPPSRFLFLFSPASSPTPVILFVPFFLSHLLSRPPHSLIIYQQHKSPATLTQAANRCVHCAGLYQALHEEYPLPSIPRVQAGLDTLGRVLERS